MIKKAIFLRCFLLVFICCISLLSNAQQNDSTSINNTDSLINVKIAPQNKSKADTVKTEIFNPGKIAGRNALYKSLTIPGWGQLYNNQILVKDYKAKGEKGGHFWQKTYTLGKVGLIYGGFGILTYSYIDNSKLYRKFLAEAQFRTENPGEVSDPDLVRYSSLQNIITAKNVYKRNRQVVIFSMAGVYLINAIDAYIAARLHYFNVDDNLAFKISPTIINSPGGMLGYQATPAIKLSFLL